MGEGHLYDKEIPLGGAWNRDKDYPESDSKISWDNHI